MARNQRLNATLTIGAALQASVRRSFDVVGRGLQRVGAEIGTTNQRMRELDRQRDVLRRQGQSVDALDREYQQLNATLRRLEDRQRRLRAVQGALAGVGGAFTQMTSEVTRFARRSAIVIGAAAGSIFGLSATTARLGDEVAKTADRLGVGIEALQEYRYAAERTGVGSAVMDSALETMNRNVGQATMGLGRARRAFSELGLEVSDLAAMRADERFELIADALNGVENEAQRTALATQIFGADLGNLTREGAEGLRALRDDARALGFVLSEETARDAENFQDALLDAQLGVQGLRNTIGSELMPVVTDVMREFTGWLRENREPVSDFAQRLGEGLRDAVPVIGEVVKGMASLSGAVGSGIARVAEFVGGWERLGAIIGVVFAGRAIASVLNFGFALGKLGAAVVALVAPGALPAVAAGIRFLGRALLTTPLGLAIAAIAGGAYLIWKNWEPISEWFAQLWGNVTDLFSGFGEFLAGIFTGDMDRAVGGLRGIWDGFVGYFGTIWDGIAGVASYAWENAIAPVLDRMGMLEPLQAAWETARARIGDALGGISGLFPGFQESAREVLSGVGRFITSVFAGDMESATDAARATMATYGAAWRETWGGIVGVVGQAWENGIAPVLDRLGMLDGVTGAWEGFTATIGGLMDQAGGAFDSLSGAVLPVLSGIGDALSSLIETGIDRFFGAVDTGVNLGIAAWERFSDALGRIIEWLGGRFQWLLDKLEPILNAGARLREIGGSISEGAARFNPFSETFDPLGRRQERAIGGNFLPGAVLVGERGPELRFESRAGFIATNRQLNSMASRAAQVAAIVGGIGTALPAAAVPAPVAAVAQAMPGHMAAALPAPLAAFSQVARAMPGAVGGIGTALPAIEAQAAPEPIAQIADLSFGRDRAAPEGSGAISIDVGGITINAPAGSDPRAIADQVMRELRRRTRGALYDPATDAPGG